MFRRFEGNDKSGPLTLVIDSDAEKFGYPIVIQNERYTPDDMLRLIKSDQNNTQIYGVDLKGEVHTISLGKSIHCADLCEYAEVERKLSTLYEKQTCLEIVNKQTDKDSIVIEINGNLELVPIEELCSQFKNSN